MPVGFTLGSVGDIISLCIIIKDVVKAFDESKGAAGQYQEIVRELWELDRVLLEVELLWRTCEESIELNALRVTSHRMVDQCRKSIEVFLEKIQKYTRSLREGGSGNRLRDTARKLEWQMLHSEEVNKFRAEINAHCSAISMLLVTASVNQSRIHSKNLHNRFDSSVASAKDQKQLLEDVKSRLDEVQKQTEANNSASSQIMEALRLDWIRQLGQDLRKFVRKIFWTNLAIYRAVIEIRGQIPSRLERGLYQEPFLLEDAIGRIAPVHMQFISSWDAFDAVLELRFRNVQGYQMVQDKKYVILESATKREIHRSQAWDASFLPGQKVVMSMLFDNLGISNTSCPRCQTPSTELSNAETQCTGCRMWYQRITEYIDVGSPNPLDRIESQRLQSSQPSFGQPPFKLAVFGPMESEKMSRKRKREEAAQEVTQFKRIRLLSRKKKPVSTPFSRYAKSSNLFASKTTVECNRRSSINLSPKTLTQSSVRPGPKDARIELDAKTSGSDDTDSDINGISELANGFSHARDPSSLNVLPIDLEMISHELRSSGSSDENTDDDALSSEGDENTNNDASSSEGDEEDMEDDTLLDNLPDNEPSITVRSSINDEGTIDAEGNQDFAFKDAVQTHNTSLDRYPPTDSQWFAETTQLMEAAERGEVLEVQRLIHNGAQSYALDFYGRSALQLAAVNGHSQVAQVLIDNAPEYSASIPEAKRAEAYAAAGGHIKLLRLLIEHELSHSGSNKRGITPLHLVAARGQEFAVAQLLQEGDDVHATDKQGQTPLDQATANGHHVVVKMLQSGVKETHSHWSLYSCLY